MFKRNLKLLLFLILISILFISIFESCRGQVGKNGSNISASKKNGVIMLPKPSEKGNVSLEESLWRRKSVRNFSDKELTEKEIGQILWAAQGINRPGTDFKTCPSAGATYPLVAYAVTKDSIFRYIPKGHKLEKVRDGDLRKELSKACLGQKWVEKAPLIVVFTAIYERTTGRYGDRGMMYIYMEAGHAAQNIHLQAAALNLGSVPVGAFKDELVAAVIRAKKGEYPLYVIPVGYPE